MLRARLLLAAAAAAVLVALLPGTAQGATGPVTPTPAAPGPRTPDSVARAWRAEAPATVVVGRSVRGRLIVATRQGRADAPYVLLVLGQMHGSEPRGRAVVAAVRGLAPPAQVQVWTISTMNPDGAAAGSRTNARGVDLNRNFPRPGGAPPSRLPFTGSGTPGAATYRGPHPLSEPETAALDRFLAARRFVASANLHSFMGTVIPARVTDRPSYATYKRLCRTFAAAQPRRRYRRLANRLFDAFTGEQEDHQHHAYGTWAVCVEVFPVLASFRQHLCAPSVFWRFNPRDPTPWIDNDLPGLAAYFAAALELADRR